MFVHVFLFSSLFYVAEVSFYLLSYLHSCPVFSILLLNKQPRFTDLFASAVITVLTKITTLLLLPLRTMAKKYK